MKNIEKPKCVVKKKNNSIFSLLRIAGKTLKKNKQEEKIEEMRDRVCCTNSYSEALSIIEEYVEMN